MPVTCLYVYHSHCSVLVGHGMSLPPLPPFQYCSYYCVKCDNGATKWGRARALTDSKRAEFNKLEKAKRTKCIRKAKKLCEAHGSCPASWQRTWNTQYVRKKSPLEQPGIHPQKTQGVSPQTKDLRNVVKALKM